MNFFRKAVVIFVGLALLYAGVVAGFVLSENSLVFHPEVEKISAPPDSLALDARRVAFRAPDGNPLVAWVIPPPATVPAEKAPWLLYFHGNGGCIGNIGYQEAWSMLRKLGIGIFPVDYEGYGESGGRPSEKNFYRDADAAYAYLRDSLGVPPSRILIYGFSLGSAVAVDLAARVPAAGLMVEGALLSVADLGAPAYPFLPVRLMVRNRFASVDKIARVDMPKLFIHSIEDEQIPFAHGRKLFELAREPKRFVEVHGGHITAFKVDPEFESGMARFLAGLGFPAPAGLPAAGG
jgi:fermentation-respiration switch protein FrsA (DUF1100 family)